MYWWPNNNKHFTDKSLEITHLLIDQDYRTLKIKANQEYIWQQFRNVECQFHVRVVI